MKELIDVIREIVHTMACREISLDTATRLMEALDLAEKNLCPKSPKEK